MTKKTKKLISQKADAGGDDQHLTEHTDSKKTEKSHKGLNRRNFIGLSLAGAAAPLITNPLSAATSVHNDQTDQVTEESIKANTTLPVDPATASETWDEPWVWKPHLFPGETLHLNVVEHQSPSTIVGLGNPGAALFSYNGATPGPTIRMKGDETLRVKLFNHLGLNQGDTIIGKAADAAFFAASPTQGADTNYTTKCDWELGEHVNGIHTIHTTNLHTHGLHVRPGLNTDGTHSDNIYLRVIPQDDLIKRETDPDYDGDFLLEGEQAGEAQYEFRLGEAGNQKIATHPPGTHWYHPHSHGSTNMEVASGMAGFLVVEGNVDEAINEYMTTIKDPDTTLKTGNFGYRERLMMLQRIQTPSSDQDADRQSLKNATQPTTNGSPNIDTIIMSPGDVERWRVLNGSVDGKGYIRFMVLEGTWVSESGKGVSTQSGTPRPTALPKIAKKLNSLQQLLYVDESGTRHLPTTTEIESKKQHLYQLAQDGVTLVRHNPNTKKPEYYIKDLGNNDYKNPLYQDYSNLDVCYNSDYSNSDQGISSQNNLKACYNLPNELYMSPANRADFVFQAPELTGSEQYKVYTVVAKGTAIHTENEQRKLAMANAYTGQEGASGAKLIGVNIPGDTILAYIVVKANSVSPGDKPQCVREISGPSYSFSMNDLMTKINEVRLPKYLRPIPAEEVKVRPGDRDYSVNPGKYRTRRVTYSGWGAASWPCLPSSQIRKLDPKGPKPVIDPLFLYKPSKDGVKGVPEIVAPPFTKSMAIDGKKFNPNDMTAPKPLLGTAEEWCVYNNSISLWQEYPALSSLDMADGLKGWYVNHLSGHPITRTEAKKRDMGITTRGIDHPFHIHTNPFWLMRIEVPDDNGKLVNILPEPRWQDVIWLPRNGGRVVFRSRFPDYVGKMVNHCHILQHEDNGMMQEVEITQSLAKINYEPASSISNHSLSSAEVESMNGVFKREGLDEAYRQCTRVVDNNHMDSPDLPLAYEYPAPNGVFDPPKLPKK